jgi:hypothetical protein
VLIYFARREKQTMAFLGCTFTGMGMFSPLVFANSLQDAFAMGVGMHYTQYLALTIGLYRRKACADGALGLNPCLSRVVGNLGLILGVLLLYAVLMVGLANYHGFAGETDALGGISQAFYLVPLAFQTLHFYIDIFIWRISIPHIRQSVFPYVYANPDA